MAKSEFRPEDVLPRGDCPVCAPIDKTPHHVFQEHDALGKVYAFDLQNFDSSEFCEQELLGSTPLCILT